MFEQVVDFRDESEALYQLVLPLSDEELAQPTLFKGWTVNSILGHLHMWNWAADLSLRDARGFAEFWQLIAGEIGKGRTLRDFESVWLEGLHGHELRDTWHKTYLEVAEHFGNADPKARVKWAGPDMSVRSSISARLMETWAHGQAAYDLLGVERLNTDRIRNIVVLGINTFGWTFINRKLPVPAPAPHVRLTAPSGEVWQFNDLDEANLIEGSATEFCQVVTQVRNIADTKLKVMGEPARQWMAIAQCFAGGPENPPAAGTRYRQTRS